MWQPTGPRSTDNPEHFDVAIVGGGPAGAALASRLAMAGVETVVFERSAEPRWRACGVFSSPLTRRRLSELGFGVGDIAALNRPISALNLQTTSGAECRIEYESGFACGFDRVRLDAALLENARVAGAQIRTGTVVRLAGLSTRPGTDSKLTVSPTDGTGASEAGETVRARVVVGADGPSSLVARTAGVYGANDRFHKSGITFHREDMAAAANGVPMEGRFLFGRDWYVGVAPVPDRRVNVGIVVPQDYLRAGPRDVADRLIAEFSPPAQTWMSAATTDGVTVAGRLEHHVTRAAGPSWLLVGDAIEFIDPLTGDGLNRALVSADLAADAIVRSLRGDPSAFRVYDRQVRARFRSKNVISWVLQAFLAHPALFDYALRRLGRRAGQRRTLTLVLTDQLPATRALDPTFLLNLLAP
ncbi:MAG: NAD(P)/FAD-dependent oxidoreductase [Candidatus Limnocylindrales bacterium]